MDTSPKRQRGTGHVPRWRFGLVCEFAKGSYMNPSDPLNLFLPPVREWFRAALGEPTPAQRQGWPAIAAGRNTLILAPTGSGKTLAAFLACLDALIHELLASQGSGVGGQGSG